MVFSDSRAVIVITTRAIVISCQRGVSVCVCHIVVITTWNKTAANHSSHFSNDWIAVVTARDNP